MMRILIDTGTGQLLPRRYVARLLPLMLILWPAGNAAADRLITHYTPREAITPSDSATYLEAGDTIAGFKVSSAYDLSRTHPIDGTVQPHYGIDITTPEGTKVIAPTSLKVACWWDRDGGGLVAEVSEPKAIQSAYKLLHLSYCTPGNYSQGQTFALTGATGEGTGAHLDARRTDKAEPTREDIEPFLTGKPAKPTLSDQELICTIGAAEGTRDSDCQPNQSYIGHTDPGNGAANIGTFSYQHGARSPEEADRKQIKRLRVAETELQAAAVAKFDRPLSKVAIATGLDLWNQSPKAAADFIDHLPTAAPTEKQIVKARSRSYIDSETGRLDAPGLGNNPKQVEADQARRTGEVINQLQRRRLNELDK